MFQSDVQYRSVPDSPRPHPRGAAAQVPSGRKDEGQADQRGVAKWGNQVVELDPEAMAHEHKVQEDEAVHAEDEHMHHY